eukprot:gene9261-10053_t
MSYDGVFLSSKSQKVLEEWWTQEVGKLLPSKYMHHMTIKFQPSHKMSRTFPSGSLVTLQVIGYGKDDMGEAVVVKCPRCPSMNDIAHITVAINHNCRPVYSNSLLKKGWTAVSNGPILFGCVQSRCEQFSNGAYDAIMALDAKLVVPDKNYLCTEPAESDDIHSPNEYITSVRFVPSTTWTTDCLFKIKETLPPSDFLLIVTGQELELHRFVLSCVSSYFRGLPSDESTLILENDETDNNEEKKERYYPIVVELILFFYQSLKLISDASLTFKLEDIPLVVRLLSHWKIYDVYSEDIFQYIRELFLSQNNLLNVFPILENIKQWITIDRFNLMEKDLWSKIKNNPSSQLIASLPWPLMKEFIIKWMNRLIVLQHYEEYQQEYDQALIAYLSHEKSLMNELKLQFPLENDPTNCEEVEKPLIEKKVEVFSTKWATIIQEVILKRNEMYERLMQVGSPQISRFEDCVCRALLDRNELWPEEEMKELLQANDWILIKEYLFNLDGKDLKARFFPWMERLNVSLPSELIILACCERRPKVITERIQNIQYFHADYDFDEY